MTTLDSDRSERDYAGAIYGSLLAASVVAGTGPAHGTIRPWELAILLVATGTVFWLAHVYAHAVGGAPRSGSGGWARLGPVLAREQPIIEAGMLPAAAAIAGMILGLSDSTCAWLALGVAVAGQTGAAVAATVASGAGRRVVALSIAVNLVLGLSIVVLKAALGH
jgi:hypothetical protein